MNKIAIAIGLVLVVVGLFGYFGGQPTPATSANPAVGSPGAASSAPNATATAGKKSKTALIPAVFGTLILMCGTLALEPRWRKHAMHAAAGIALLGGIAASYMFLTKLPGLLSSDPTFNRRSPIFIGLMALCCLVYVGLSVRSFIQARRSRAAGKA